MVFGDDVLATLEGVQEWGPLVLGVGGLVVGGVVGYGVRRGAVGSGAVDSPDDAARPQTVAADTPRLSVESWHAEGDAVGFEVVNAGVGSATDLSAVVELDGAVEARTRLRSGGSSTLGAGEEATVEAEPVFRGVVDGEATVGVHSAVATALRAAGHGRATVRVAVEYTGPADRTQRNDVWEAEAAVGDSLEATVENGRGAVTAEGLPPE